MAGADRHALDAVSAPRSTRAAARAEFFQTVRLILAAYRGSGAGIGGDAQPESEPIRFRAAAGLRHPDAEIVAIDPPAPDRPIGIEIGFMGLTGPSGVMPDHYSDKVVAGRRARDEAMGRFFDVFNHRMLSHFYRAWAKYRLPISFEESAGDLSDPFSRALAALAGFARTDGEPRSLGMAGPMARRIRSAGALRRILTASFDLPIEVIELRPRWIAIADADRTALGGAARPSGNFAALGGNAVIGRRAYTRADRFRVRIGPLDEDQCRDLLIEDALRDRIMKMIRFTVGPNLTFDLQMVLRREAVPPLELRATSRLAALGRTTWLLSRDNERDRDEPVYRE